MAIFDWITDEELHRVGITNGDMVKVLRGFAYGNNNSGKMSKEDFLSIKEEQFDKMRGVGEARKLKFIWFQKYLKGEVSGIYEKEKSDNLEIAKLEDKIQEIRKRNKEMEYKFLNRIKELEQNNKALKNEITRYRKIEKKIDELKRII